MAKSKGLKVYLDHHIKRESLLYRKSSTQKESLNAPVSPLLEGVEAYQQQLDTASFARYLAIQDLHGRRSKARSLRKPDFQRATWAWTPEECVSLLEAVLYERVVPSVIMWLSPESFQYVLDGGHRISVLLAWIKDDWGDRLPADYFQDPLVMDSNREAARTVREMLAEKKIGTFEEWEDAENAYNDLLDQGKNPKDVLPFETLRYADRLRRWSAVDIGFPILWVKGDQDVAEESFLAINKTGRQLSEWETKLVENRTSSFARVVMSVSQISGLGPQHCWPSSEDPEVEKEPALKAQVANILELVHILHELVFVPPHRKPISSEKQPLLAISSLAPENTPAYLAELLTVCQGRKGQKAEMQALITKDVGARPAQIIANGERLLEETIDAISEIYGPSPRSMGLFPLLYYYNKQGRHVRSLLYGTLFWITHGTAAEVINRKLLFTVYRGQFEFVLREYKEQIIKRIGRKIGSGTEVTVQTARYLNGLLKLILEFKGQIDSESFESDHLTLIRTLGKINADEEIDLREEEESTSRTFRGGNKDAVQVRDFLDHTPKCEVCGGLYYPGQFTQIDHKMMWGDGGKTKVSNARNTHPFCNNRRIEIESLVSGKKAIDFPDFEKNQPVRVEEQLSFLFGFDEYEDELTSFLEENGQEGESEEISANVT